MEATVQTSTTVAYTDVFYQARENMKLNLFADFLSLCKTYIFSAHF